MKAETHDQRGDDQAGEAREESRQPGADTEQHDGEGREAMLPHHQQAVEMADLALDPMHEASPAVQDLATRIKTAQAAEIADMNGWLEEWGAEPV